MNYVSHLYVADQLTGKKQEARHEFLFGAMAPDFMSMIGTKPNKKRLNGNIALGVDLHYETDSVFDSMPEFTRLKTEARDDFLEYLPRSSARACADMGTELLLDGEVLSWQNTAKNYSDVMFWALDDLNEIGRIAIDSFGFSKFIDKYSHEGIPVKYKNPKEVSKILHRRLDSRPRLAFDPEHIDRLAETIEVHQQRVRNCSVALVKATVEALRN